MKALLALLFSAVFLSGCMASFGGAKYERSERLEAEAAYYEALARVATQEQPPLFELVATGEPITGIERITVNAPGEATQITQYAQPRSEWAPVVGNVLSSVAPLAFGMWGTYEITKAATAAVASVARNPTVVEQPPPFVVTQPDPTVVEQPAPIIVPPTIVDQPAPIIVQPPTPITVEQPAPIVIEQPAPIIVEQPVLAPGGF